MPPATLGEFEVVILLAVLHLGERGYPPGVRAEIQRRTGREPSRGAVYVTLDRLERKGLLNSRLEEASGEREGRPRRVYRATPRGLRMLRRSLTALAQMQLGLEPLLGSS
jgi:PadR family transcriptional regulator, regulatory protein PadR